MAEKQIDPRKLCLMKLDVDESDDIIRKKCERYGPIKHFQRPANKELAFVLYGDENVAKAAKDGLSQMGINVNFARAKKIDVNNNFGGEKTERSSVQQRIWAKSTSPDQEFETATEPISTPDSTVIKEPIAPSNGFVRTATSIQNIDRYFGTCIYCNHDASLTCQRCGDFYCSEECQDADWLAHKRVCFPMPKLTPPKPFVYGLRRSIINIPTDVSVSAENLSIMKRNSLTIDSIDGIKKLPPKIQDIEKESTIVEAAPAKPAPQEVVKSPEMAKPMPDKVKTPVVSTPEVDTNTPNTVIGAKENSVASVSVKGGIRGRGKFLEEMIDDSKPKTSTRPTIDQIEVTTIKDGDVIEVTAVLNHHSLYIRSMDFNDEYVKLTQAVIHASATALPITGIPEKNQIVLAPFEGAYYRALILSYDRDLDQMSVAFIDYGNTDWISRKSLKNLSEDLLKHRRQPIRVFLKDVEKDVDDDEKANMKAYLKQLEYNEFKVKSKNPIIATKSTVELIDMKTDKIINKSVAKLAKERYFETQIQKKQLDVECETVLIIESRRFAKEAIVTCVLQSDGTKFSEQHEVIQEYGESIKNDGAYSPRHLELCVVKILEEDDPIWYRAQYQQQLVDGRAQVALIDYGITDNVLENDIRVFNKKLVFECLALTCSVKKGVAPKAEMLSKLTTFARAKTVSIKPVEGTAVHAVDFEWGSIH